MNKILQLINDNKPFAKPLNVVKNEGEASLYIYDVIDDWMGVSATAVTSALNQASGAEVLNVYINSPGGSVFEARAIMAALQRFEGKKVAHIDSLCASAATSIALACDEVQMTDGAFFMIHNASGIFYGDKNELRDSADLLEKIETSIVDDYANKTGMDKENIITMMNEETWMTATEAKEYGFVDMVTDSPSAKPKNAWNLAAYTKAPEELKNIQLEPEAEPVAEPVKSGTSTANANKLKLIASL